MDTDDFLGAARAAGVRCRLAGARVAGRRGARQRHNDQGERRVEAPGRDSESVERETISPTSAPGGEKIQEGRRNRCRSGSRKQGENVCSRMESDSVNAVVPAPTTTLVKKANRNAGR